jgi:hypothetical protein
VRDSEQSSGGNSEISMKKLSGASSGFHRAGPSGPIRGTRRAVASRRVNHMRPDHAITFRTFRNRRSNLEFRFAAPAIASLRHGPSAAKVTPGSAPWMTSKSRTFENLGRVEIKSRFLHPQSNSDLTFGSSFRYLARDASIDRVPCSSPFVDPISNRRFWHL